MEMSVEAVRKNLNYLEHHGVKGQRWGVRRTPEQLGHILQKKNARHYGKYNAAVRKISKIQGDKSISQLSEKERKKMIKATDLAKKYMERIQSDEAKYTKKIDKATAKQEAKETKLAEKESEKQAKEKERTDKIKEEIYKNNDWKKAYENKELFSNQELNDLANRVNAEKRLKSELARGEGLDKLADNIKKVSNLAGAGLDAYDKYNKIKGIFEEGKKESAYKEIRQLMADGKNAEVIKKSIGISDKDVEVFNKRKAFLDSLKRDIPQKQQSSQTEQTNESKKKEKEKKADKNKKNESENNNEFIKGLNTVKLEKEGPSSSLKNPVNTMTMKSGKGKKAQSVDLTTFNYDDYTRDMMQKVASRNAEKQKKDVSGTKFSTTVDSSNAGDSWYSGKGADTTWAGLTETQRKFNITNNSIPLTTKGLLAERYRVDRVSESKLTDSQKRRVNEIAEAAHSIVLNNQADTVNRIVEDNSKKTLNDVKPKLSKEKVSGLIENASSDSIFNKKRSEVLNSYSGLFEDANADYNYKKKMDKSYDILNSISKKEADDLKYFIPGTAYAYVNDGSMDGFPFNPISGSDPKNAGKIANNKPWKDYELKHFMKFMKTLEHSYINNKKEARKIIDKYEILILNDIGDFKLSDFKK